MFTIEIDTQQTEPDLCGMFNTLQEVQTSQDCYPVDVLFECYSTSLNSDSDSGFTFCQDGDCILQFHIA